MGLSGLAANLATSLAVSLSGRIGNAVADGEQGQVGNRPGHRRPICFLRGKDMFNRNKEPRSGYPHPQYGASPKHHRIWLWLVLLVALVFTVWASLRTGDAPEIVVNSQRPAFGGDNQVQVTATSAKRGLYRVATRLTQGERQLDLGDQQYDPAPSWKFWSSGTAEDQLSFPVTHEQLEGWSGEEITVEVSAWPAPTWLRRPAPQVITVSFPVRRSAPRISVASSHHYPRQGGAEAVVYRVGEHAERSGVEVGEVFFPGHPVPGRDGEWFSLFAVPYDVDQPNDVQLVAENDAGMTSRRTFVDRLMASPPTTDTIELPDSFLEKVVPEIMTATPELEDHGGLLENYLAINGGLRQKNTQTLRDLADFSRAEFLWRGAFLPLPNGQVMSSFADRRTYVYDGQAVDQQTHLGYDLASVRRAPVPSANRGVVAMAEYFGIYGNTVVVDHGFGLMTLYAHLSSIDVEQGQEIERGDVVGRTGATGLAGGDHLHYTVLVGGEQVNPTEWWDGKWINDRLREKLGPEVIVAD